MSHARAVLCLTSIVLTAAACSGSPAPTPRTACQLLTPAVIRAAHFPDRMYRQTKGAGVTRHGVSYCIYADDPNPNDISPSALVLFMMTPAALRAEHRAAEAYAAHNIYPCTRAERRTFGPEDSFAAHAYFCASHVHAPAGGWVQHGTVYELEVGDAKVDYGTTAERVAEFEDVARAIAAEVDGRLVG